MADWSRGLKAQPSSGITFQDSALSYPRRYVTTHNAVTRAGRSGEDDDFSIPNGPVDIG